MKRSRLLRFAVIVVTAAFLLLPHSSKVSARADQHNPPPGFEMVDSATGVEFFRKDYSGGTPDFVQVIDLSRGAQVHLLYGDIAEAGIGRGAYGGDSPSFTLQTLQQFWDRFAKDEKNAFCLSNGAFFSTNDDPAPLAFPLKSDEKLISQGYGASEYPDQKLMLEIWSDHAKISPLSGEALASSTAPQILAGLGEYADKNPSSLTGRTFMGVQDTNSDGKAETVFLFNSKTAKQSDAVAVLRSFGAEKVIMLDGGDSTQLICKNNPQVYSNRSIPQAVAISSGTAQALAATVTSQTDWSVLVEGETTQVDLTLRNDGTETWLAGDVRLVNRKNDWGAGEYLDLPVSVAPGETISFSWTTIVFPRRGVFTSEWYMARGSKNFSDHPILINVIVLPQELADKKTELENQVREWGRQQLENIEQLVLDWIQERVREGFDKICPAGASLPLFVAAAGGWQFLRRKKH